MNSHVPLKIISICFLLIITFAALSPSLQNGFTNWDDHTYVTECVMIKNLSWKGIGKIFTSTHLGGYEPLTLLSFAVEYHFFKLNPRVYHTTNLVFHLLNSLLVLWLIYILTGSFGISCIVALLFGIHPLHVESVAWISERKDMLYAFFSLGTMISYLYYRKSGAIRYYYFSLFLFLLSLLPKPQGVLLPFVLLLFDYYLGRKIDRKNLKEKIPFFALSVIFILIAVKGGYSAGDLKREYLFTIPLNIHHAVYGLAFYLLKLAFPVNLSCLYPGLEKLGEAIFSLYILLSFLLMAAIITGVIFSVRYGKKIIFAGLFFLIMILPVLQVIPTGPAITADRYTYIPSIGLFYLAGFGLFRLYREKIRESKFLKISFPLILIAATLTLFSLTYRRCLVWRDSETLWEDAIKKFPDAPIACNNMGEAYFSRGRVHEAIKCYRDALKKSPGFAEAYINLANAFARQGRFDKAILNYGRAIRIKPGSGKAYSNLGAAFLDQGEWEKAEQSLEKALELEPDSAGAHNNLGNALFRQGNFAGAIGYYRKALELNPDFAEAANNLAVALIHSGRYEEAKKTLKSRLFFYPEDTLAAINLARLLSTCPDKNLRDAKEAVRLAETVCRETGYQGPAALDTLASAYASAGRLNEANRVAKKAQRLNFSKKKSK